MPRPVVPRLPMRPFRCLARGALLAIALVVGPAGVATACEFPPHRSTDLPESVVFDGPEGHGLWAAWYDAATTRYTHGVLGDAVEGGALYAYAEGADNNCDVIGLTLDAAHVFEDIAPRLVDLDGDGANEILTVRSSLTQGAQLAIYGDAGDGSSLTLLATTPYIGRANRWLAPIGAADLDGDGRMEIAYIDRPHLARTLRIWRYQGAALTEVAAATGLTNHRIGEDFISSGIRTCDGPPEILTANADWSRLIASRFDGTTITARDLGPYSAAALEAALACR